MLTTQVFESEQHQSKKERRIVYLDILRVLSIISVITIHTVAVKIQDMSSLGGPGWWWANVLNGITRWAVPVFFMISGILMLNDSRLDDISSFIKLRLLKIGVPFLVWSVIYSIVKETYILGNSICFPDILGTICINILLDKSYYHLWFVYDIFIIYLISPFLRKIVINSTQKELRYWLGLWFAATVLYTSIQQFIMFIGGEKYFYIHILNIPFVFGLIGYYILGYYLHRYDLSKKRRIVIYVGAIFSVFLTIWGTYAISASKRVLNESLYSHFAITTVTISTAVMLFIKNIQWEKFLTESFQQLLKTLSNSAFGIYLIHMILIIHFSGSLSTVMPKSYVLYTILIIYISFALSFIFVKLIRLIPYVGNYLV